MEECPYFDSRERKHQNLQIPGFQEVDMTYFQEALKHPWHKEDSS